MISALLARHRDGHFRVSRPQMVLDPNEHMRLVGQPPRDISAAAPSERWHDLRRLARRPTRVVGASIPPRARH
jgi:hypothetical protein